MSPSKASAPISMEAFLLSPRTQQVVPISELLEADFATARGNQLCSLKRVDLRLECHDAKCGGVRRFVCISTGSGTRGQTFFTFMHYRCTTCEKSVKRFALFCRADDLSAAGSARKLAEEPPFGPGVSARLREILGSEVHLFEKGLESEGLGLGIGAFGYYRRVVEAQWSRIIGALIAVAEEVHAPPEVVERLRAVEQRREFKWAVNDAAEVVELPNALYLLGQNPLLLLHGALSRGLHALTDDSCLAQATNVRLVLEGLSGRVDSVMKDRERLAEGLKGLLKDQRDASK